jgi:hypothetical protein
MLFMTLRVFFEWAHPSKNLIYDRYHKIDDRIYFPRKSRPSFRINTACVSSFRPSFPQNKFSRRIKQDIHPRINTTPPSAPKIPLPQPFFAWNFWRLSFAHSAITISMPKSKSFEKWPLPPSKEKGLRPFPNWDLIWEFADCPQAAYICHFSNHVVLLAAAPVPLYFQGLFFQLTTV